MDFLFPGYLVPLESLSHIGTHEAMI